jgi:hypothetical protein
MSGPPNGGRQDPSDPKLRRVYGDGSVTDGDGGRSWWFNGNRHRDNGPAIIGRDGVLAWFREGLEHREDGPAVIRDGIEEWYLNGKRHRVDGPALSSRVSDEWWLNGERHRIDGPATIFKLGNGMSAERWFVRDREITLEVFDLQREQGYAFDWRTWGATEWTMFRIRFAGG